MNKLVLISTLALSASALADKWDGANNPRKLEKVTGVAIVTEFSALPLTAKLSNQHYIWSDTWWRNPWGGITYRWNAEPNPENFTYRFMNRDEVKAATLGELERLSPTEKYDIYMGNYDYPLTRKVRALYNPKQEWWEGICHGWSMAAVSHVEPARNDLTNKDGVVVPFGSTDVKGLLGFYYAKVHKTEKSTQLGRRCSIPGKVPGEAYPQDDVRFQPPFFLRGGNCADMNAGAFHVALANMIGLQDKGLIVEVDRYADVWNQPVGEYTSRIISTKTTKKGSEIRIKLDMTYGEESNTMDPQSRREEDHGFVSMDPVTGTPDQLFSTRHYEYTLELDKSGNITGGEWISNTRPDFLWLKEGAQTYSDEGYGLSGLNDIYRPVID